MIYTSPELLPNFALVDAPVDTFHQLISYVQSLPYARTSDRTHLNLVLKEKCGTCSSKHAFLAHIANTHGHPEVLLEIGIFEITTPTFSFPEAHCYLVYAGNIFDFTHGDKRTVWHEKKPVDRFIFDPVQIATKEAFHKAYVKTWAEKRHLPADEVWEVREAYIRALADNSTKTARHPLS